MKNRTFKMNLCVHNVSIHVSFPCTVGASLQIDNQELQITDNVDIKQAQVQINASVHTDVSLLYNLRTKVYSVKKAVVNFFLRTKSGKLQAGSTAIFLNKSIEGCTKETVSINKCSDRQASFQYSLTLEFIEQFDTNMPVSMLKESQVSENMRNSSISYGNKVFENSHLYESIVQEVDEKTDPEWDKMSNDSKANSCAPSFISDFKQTQSSKNLVSNWRNPQVGIGFRKSRIQGSVEQARRSAIFQSNSVYQSKLSASKAHFQQQEQDRKLLSQKKINDLEKQNKEMKESLVKIREQFQEKMLQEKTSLMKSQIQQTSLREELDIMKQKFSNLEKQAKKMMFQKNELLNKYNNKQVETISQVKAKQKSLTFENKRLSQKSQRLQKQLAEQQEKCRMLDSKFRQQQISLSKNKKLIEYYQQEAMQLDEKVSEMKLIEQQLNNEIEKLKDEMSKKQENHQKEMLKQRKDLNNIKEFKENESKGLGQQLTSLKNQFKEKQHEINTLKKDFQAEKRRLNQHQSNLRQQNEKLQKQLKGLRQQIILSFDNENEAKNRTKQLEQKIRFLQQEMKNIVRNRDEVLEDMEQRLEELNHQQFQLNEQNFEFQEKIAILENELKERNYSHKNLADSFEKVEKELSSKVQEVQRIHEQYEKILQQSSALTIETKIKIQKKDEIIRDLNDKIDKLEAMIQQKESSNHAANDEICLLHQSIEALEKQNMQVKNQNKLLLKNLQQVNNNLTESHGRIDQLLQQIQKANEKIEIQTKKGQISLQSKSTLMQFVLLFQTTFSAILTKDYSTNTSSEPSKSFKYGSNNNRRIPNSTPVKKSSTEQTSDIKKLQSYSQKNVQFATKFSVKLQQLQTYLNKIHKKLFQTEKALENQISEKERYRIAEEKTSQEIIQLHNTIHELNQEIQNSSNTHNKVLQNFRSENLKAINEMKKQNHQITRQLTQLKKQMQRKNYESMKTNNLQGDLNKKIQTLTAQSKENLQKFQKSNQELAMKNKQINELQSTIREKAIQISKLKAKIVEFEQELNKTKKEKDDLSKLLVIQQQQNSKSLLTIKDQKQLLLKKEQTLKQAQKQLKVMEGKLFIQRRVSPPPLNFDGSQSSVSIATYSSKKVETKKQIQSLVPKSGTFAYRKNYTSSKKIPQNQCQIQSDQSLKNEIQNLKQNIIQKQKVNRQLQQKLKSSKQINFSKNTSVPVKSSISQDEEVMRQKILENLQAIQTILSVQQTGGRFDKYRLQLGSLINKNKKIISEGSPFEQMRKICIIIQKAKTNVQNKLKLQNEAKSVIIEEFMKIQTIVDEVMGK